MTSISHKAHAKLYFNRQGVGKTIYVFGDLRENMERGIYIQNTYNFKHIGFEITDVI